MARSMPRTVALVLVAVAVAALAGVRSDVRGTGTAAAQTTYTATSPSWNPRIPCRAVVTTLATVLGSGRSPQGGATFAGGGFRPGVPDRRAAPQPCVVQGVPVFVELRQVVLGACNKINKDGDWTCIVSDPSRPAGPRNRIHVETGTSVRALGGWSVPPGGRRLDVQGFVFWDPDHVGAQWHDYTGWEIHSLTAWRPAG